MPGPGHRILTRDKSQAHWQSAPGYLSLNLTVDDYGRSRNTATTPEPEPPLPDSLGYLRRIMAQEQQTAATIRPPAPGAVPYGSNPAVGHHLPVRAGRLYYERYGQGTPLLLLHGNGQSIAAFRYQLGELARHSDVIALDTRAQGRSQDFTPTDLSYRLFANDVVQLLDSLHLLTVDILGWSDGGNTALELALANPGRVRRLVVMGANLFPGPTALNPDLLTLLRRQLHEAELHPDPEAPNRARLVRLLLREPQLTFAQMAAITVPVLVMAGEHDVILEAHTRALVRSLPQGELLLLPGASHYAPQEVPEVFNRAVREFLNRP